MKCPVPCVPLCFRGKALLPPQSLFGLPGLRVDGFRDDNKTFPRIKGRRTAILPIDTERQRGMVDLDGIQQALADAPAASPASHKDAGDEVPLHADKSQNRPASS